MANWMEPKEEEWEEWLSEREMLPHVEAVARKYPPWKLFRLADSGHRCHVIGYSEILGGDKVTLQVAITGRFNLINFGRRVFGVKPEDLTECELPGPDEPVGTTMTDDEQFLYINEKRIELGVKPLTREQYNAMKNVRGDEDDLGCALH